MTDLAYRSHLHSRRGRNSCPARNESRQVANVEKEPRRGSRSGKSKPAYVSFIPPWGSSWGKHIFWVFCGLKKLVYQAGKLLPVLQSG